MKRCLSVTVSLLFFGNTFFCQAQLTSPDGPRMQIERIRDSSGQYERLGDTEKALQYYKMAAEKARSLGLPEHEARALIGIAGSLKNRDASQSLQHLQNALKIAERLNHHVLKADIYLAMAEVYKQQQNYAEALAALEQHHRLVDEILIKNKNAETEKVRIQQKRIIEHITGLVILIAVISIAGVFIYYYRKIIALNKKLRTTNEIKDKLFSIIGHDLRGPAGNIIQGIQLIESGALSEKQQKEMFGLLKTQSFAFTETLNTLLKWANTQLRGAATTPVAFDPGVLIKKNMALLDGLAKDKNIHFVNDLAEGIEAYADINHIDFVIRNLLSNAIKFSRENGQVEVITRDTGKTIEVVVKDHGTGISPEKLQQFESASYIESSFGTKGEKGTGLGLMLSKEFISANKGDLSVTSKEGQGSTFRILLPVKIANS